MLTFVHSYCIEHCFFISLQMLSPELTWQRGITGNFYFLKQILLLFHNLHTLNNNNNNNETLSIRLLGCKNLALLTWWLR